VSSQLVRNPAGGKPLGTPVANSDLGVRVFDSATDGYSLATIGSTTYPAHTANGGKTWTIAGPVLHAAAAQGALAVDQLGTRDANTAFAWEGTAPNTVVDFTRDAGRHWWRAFFPGSVLFVGTNGGQVFATVYGTVRRGAVSHTGVWIYRTANGRTWTYSSAVH
jgi:hypothetical protein